jgi:hypothetical protein
LKGIEILISKGFGIICKCVESMGGGWLWHNSYIKKIDWWTDIFINKNINPHNYLIKIHSFSPMPICIPQVQHKHMFKAHCPKHENLELHLQ